MAYTYTFEDLQTRLRLYLQDTDESIWTDSPLNQMLNDAITMHTTEVPFPTSTSFNVVSGTTTYDLPDDFVEAKLVAGYFTDTSQLHYVGALDLDGEVPFTWADNDEPVGFIVNFPEEGQIYFPYAPTGSTFTLYYWQKIVGDLAEEEDTLDLGQRAWSALAINALAAYMAHLPSATYRAFLEQWARRQDLNVGNPLKEMGDAYLREYERIVAKFTEGGNYGR